ncbi:Ankyrin repeat domain-containing protein 27-like protein [Leptotrombidium deliense]|uniref:Ankyrin repeat domain-containing protein 27-like protein n=1 Tax=Leptotrombidium deliense TaxID=299467 RepID=A0A443SAQ0_9ACAR|nr:Ankyrin repeat domain-containing protein 27-like protein [Leptotrombidium deliense]
MSERLDKNPFYRTLVKEFVDIYYELNANQWIVCVPSAQSLQCVQISRNFVCGHILKPSPLLKWHYIPLISNEISDVEIDNTFVIITRNNDENDKKKIAIIGEEIAYNSESKPYKIFVISSPLLWNFERMEAKKSEFDRNSLVTFTECKSYLRHLSTNITDDIEQKTRKLSSTYLILPSYLDDASRRFQAVVDWGVNRLQDDAKILESDEEFLPVAVESVVIGLVYSKIFEAVKKRFAAEEELFQRNCLELKRCQLTPVDLGAQAIFKSVKFAKSFLECALNLESKVTPLEKVYSLKKVVDSINGVLGDYIKNLSSPFGCANPCESIVGDDLVACLIYLLCETQVINLVNNVSFIKIFGEQLSQKNEFGYSLVTFEVAIEFIKQFDKCNSRFSSTSPTPDNNEIPRDKTKSECENKEFTDFEKTDLVTSRFDTQLENIRQLLNHSQQNFSHVGSHELETSSTTNHCDDDKELG